MSSSDGVTDDVVRGKAKASREKKKNKKNEILTFTQKDVCHPIFALCNVVYIPTKRL